MNTPVCPNCHERMSSVELGLGGLWSCIYCEGVWLDAKQLQEVARKAKVSLPQSHAVTAVGAVSYVPVASPRKCPTCAQVQLQEVRLGDAQALTCASCGGAFFEKGVVTSHAAHLAKSAEEAPVVQVLAGIIGTVALLGEPLPLILALASNGKRSNTAL